MTYSPPLSSREIVGCYTSNHWEGVFDVYVIFRSGIVMYTECCDSVIHAMNSTCYQWEPSVRHPDIVRASGEFEGFFPAPCAPRL